MRGLEPVRTYHLEVQRARAAAAVSDARARAEEIRVKAEAEARELIAAAEREGQSSAEQDTNREWTAARRRARGLLLAAQREVYDDLRRRCADAIRGDRRYPALERQVADQARRQIGPGAEIESRQGTLIASRKTRHVRWSLDELVEDLVSGMPDDVTGLWA